MSSLTNLGNSFSTGIDTINQHLLKMSHSQIPNLAHSLSRLDPNSPCFELQKKTTDERLTEYRTNTDNIRNIITSSMEGLRAASDALEIVDASIQQIESAHEWANAGTMKKTYLVAASGLQTVKNGALSPIRYLNNHSSELATLTVIGLAGGIGYAIGRATTPGY